MDRGAGVVEEEGVGVVDVDSRRAKERRSAQTRVAGSCSVLRHSSNTAAASQAVGGRLSLLTRWFGQCATVNLRNMGGWIKSLVSSARAKERNTAEVSRAYRQARTWCESRGTLVGVRNARKKAGVQSRQCKRRFMTIQLLLGENRMCFFLGVLRVR